MKTLIKNTTAYLGNELQRVDHVDILIDSVIIASIGRNITSNDCEIVDGSDFFVTPGFVNSHFHPSQQLNRALGVGISHDAQMDLLHATDRIKTAKDAYFLSHIAILEGLKAGTTCFYSVGSEIETQIEVFNKLGVRAACAMIPKDVPAGDKEQDVRAKTWSARERIDKAEEIHTRFHNDLVRIHFGVANVRYASDELVLGMLDLANKYGVGFQMHAAESMEYVQKVLERTGHREVEHLYHIGALNERVSLAHSVHLNRAEIEYIASTKAHVIHCPRSNSYVGVGVCPVKELLDANVNVALGSDAAINNNSNEVRGEAHSAFDKLADKYQRADIIDYKTLFKMLTINGAKAMGINNEIGTLEVGKKADLVLWSKNDYPFIPGFNYMADLIFTDSCRAHTVMVNGVPVIQKYLCTRIDEMELIQKARIISEKYYQESMNFLSKISSPTVQGE